MSAASSSSVIVLDDPQHDTATSPYFAESAAALSWPAAERSTSTLAGGQWNLRALCDDHGVPREYTPSFAGDKAACAADCPADTICVYVDALDAGMRFPLHGFHAALLLHYGLAPAQLAPNAWRYVAAFVVLCEDAAVEPRLSVFQHFFSLCTHKGDAAGWHHLKPTSGVSSDMITRRLFTGKVSTTTYLGWKSRFFFLQAPPNAPWPCPVKWGKPSWMAVRKPPVTTDTKKAIAKLLDRVATSGSDVAMYLSRRLPVGRIIPAVKKEPGIEQTRKRKSLEREEPVTPARSDAQPSTPLAGSSQAVAGPVSGAGERSATATLSRLAQMVEADLHEKERELHARSCEVAQLKDQLRAAREEHAAVVDAARDARSRLGEELDARAADVARLSEELDAAKDAHASYVARLGEDLQKINDNHAAEVYQLREELRTTNAAHADEVCELKEQLQKARSEVQAVRTEHQRERAESSHRARGMYRHLVDLATTRCDL